MKGMIQRVAFWCVAMICLTAFPVKAQVPSMETLINQDMASLLSTPVGMLTTSSNASYAPASVTTITAEQIEMTPARNIYDLMEIYVPGAVWLTHSESPKVGIRGIISDRNNKMILLVNGRRLNSNAHNGVEAELEQWDLHDIQKIEIVRGPGSVTYGPGAIECVINITTKGAADAPGMRAGAQYMTKYDSKGVYFSDGKVKKDSNYYMYGSVVSTHGFAPKEHFVTTTAATGYLGEDSSLGNRLPLDYFNDADNEPQVKLYSEYNFWNECKVWARYTNSGTSRHGTLLNTKTILSSGDQVDLKENKDRSAVGTMENKHEFSDVLNLDSMVSLSSQDHQRAENPTNSNIAADGGKEDSMRNIIQAYSETELLVRSLLNFTLAEKYKLAAGFENSYEKFGPGWGDSKDTFRMGDSSNMLGSLSSTANLNSSTNNAVAVSSPYLIGGGWYADTFSILSEANLEFNKKFNLILSGRTDQNSYTKIMFSPRIAVVSDWEKMGITKFIWQKSVRMNTAEQLFYTNETGGKNVTETLKGYEFIYDVSPIKNLSLENSIYYNSLDVLGWSSSSLSTVPLGTANILGFDIDSKYKVSEKWTLGASQTYTKLVKFEMGTGQTRSGISYADYNVSTGAGGPIYVGTGDNLNNWANVSTKLYADYKMTPKWTFHTDARVFWGFQGAQDGLEMIENAAKGTSSQTAINNAINEIKNTDAYKTDARLDFSARYALTKDASVTFMVLNLLGLNDNKRYSYEAGVNAAAPNRATWIEEPRVYGVRVDCKF
ncbi:MAG: TonB-dependent receptor plug domain-containing protein [Candidatus Omnitrophica bacterium]|nr:TonB-dependent receptor plug domain-containing protein [Candidatus Omnitrophota bacterium]